MSLLRGAVGGATSAGNSASAATFAQRPPTTLRPNYSPIPPKRTWFDGMLSGLRSRGAGMLIVTFDLLALGISITMLDNWKFTTVLFSILLVATFAQVHLYRSRLTLSVLDDLPLILTRFFMAAGVMVLIAVILKQSLASTSVTEAGIVLLALLVGRMLSYSFIRYMRGRRYLGKRTLIVGAAPVSQGLALALKREKHSGLTPVGFVDTGVPLEIRRDLPLPLLGECSDLHRLVLAYRPDYLLFGYSYEPAEKLVDAIRDVQQLPVSISVVPRLFEVMPSHAPYDHVSDIPLIRLHNITFRNPFWWLKRVIDVLVSGFALIVLSPLLALIAIIDRVVDGPGVIFRQRRVGLDGRYFDVLKFRSLRPVDETESATNWNIKHDDRLSWFGKFLRKSSLDELPQLFNILRGDMSLVGPRPERPHFVDEFGDLYHHYGDRHRVPCGLTGWAQIHGLRGDTSIAARARYDNYYIENWSVWLDIKIILRTATSMLKGSG